ncbi:MAG TPA: tyrosine-type recombinase/integrase [Gemmataceae bacterium]|nr:tyrosine-type recombinase/integrase [Gemmataceae bacterium]
MARKASVRYWDSRGTWTDDSGQSRHGAYCCTLKGQQHVLAAGADDYPNGPNYNKAVKAFADLICLGSSDRAGDLNPCRTVIELYLRAKEKTLAPNSFRLRKKYLSAFCKTDLADLPVCRLTSLAVQQWVDDMRQSRTVAYRTGAKHSYTWGDSTVRCALTSLGAAFNWAVRSRIIQTNPLVGITRPSARSRSRDCIVSPDDHTRILAACTRYLRPLVVCLEATGCRPGELLMATAADWNENLGALVFFGASRRRPGEARHKTSGKGKDRRIVFAGESLAIMRQLVAKHRTGPLFHGRRRPYVYAAVREAFNALRKRIALPNLTPYSYRHTYATRWLESGRSIDDLAALLGNTPAIIREHDAHLCDNLDRLRGLAAGFATPPAAHVDTPSPVVLPFDAEAVG